MPQPLTPAKRQVSHCCKFFLPVPQIHAARGFAFRLAAVNHTACSPPLVGGERYTFFALLFEILSAFIFMNMSFVRNHAALSFHSARPLAGKCMIRWQDQSACQWKCPVPHYLQTKPPTQCRDTSQGTFLPFHSFRALSPSSCQKPPLQKESAAKSPLQPTGTLRG